MIVWSGGKDDWMVANLESDTPDGRTGSNGSGASGGRYAGTDTGDGDGVQTDVPVWCVACTGSACVYVGNPGGKDDWMVAKLESDTPGGRTGWTGSGALGGRYAGTETEAGAGVQTDAPGWCVACTGSAGAFAGNPGGKDDWMVAI